MQVAIKTIRKEQLKTQERGIEQIINEINILRKLDHPHILKMYEFYEDKYNLYLVTELCSGGELFDRIIN